MAAGQEYKEKLKERDVCPFFLSFSRSLHIFTGRVTFFFTFYLLHHHSPTPACWRQLGRPRHPCMWAGKEREKKEGRWEREGKRKGKEMGCIRVFNPFASFCPLTSGVPSCCYCFLFYAIFLFPSFDLLCNKQGGLFSSRERRRRRRGSVLTNVTKGNAQPLAFFFFSFRPPLFN